MPPRQPKFLIVDDFISMRRVVKALLREIGFTEVAEAENGAEALKLLQSTPFDFVISDWNMPVMDGLAMLQAIRADAKLSHTPVLMITAEAKRENIIAAAEARADGYIVKPFKSAVLHEKLEKIMRAKRAAAVANAGEAVP